MSKTHFLKWLICSVAFFAALLTLKAQGWMNSFPAYANPSSSHRTQVLQTQDGNFVMLADSVINSPIIQHRHPYLIKFSPTGQRLWTKVLTTIESDANSALLELPNGNLVVTGNEGFDAFYYVMYWAITDANGNLLNKERVSSADASFCRGASLSPSGGFIVTGAEKQGNFISNPVWEQLSENGTTQWNYSSNPPNIPNTNIICAANPLPLPNGNMLIPLYDNQANGYGYTEFLELDQFGNQVSIKNFNFPGSSSNRFYAIKPAVGGGYFVLAGDFFTVYWTAERATLYKINDGLNHIEWQRPIGQLDGMTLAPTLDGGCVVAKNNGTNLELIKYNANGNQLWQHNLLANGSPTHLVQSNDGGYCIVGHISLGEHFIIRTDANGLISANQHTVTGRIIKDLDLDCAYNTANDANGSGWLVTFTNTLTNAAEQTSTLADGSFTYVLESGNYNLSAAPYPPTQQFEACSPLASLNLTAILDTTNLGNLLYKSAQATLLQGTAFIDNNQNGSFDIGEPPLPCADIHITCDNPPLDTFLVADQNGQYSLQVSQFANYTATITTYVSTVQAASGSMAFTSTTNTTLNCGLYNPNPNIGLAIIRGKVQFDSNGDCLPDAPPGNLGPWSVRFKNNSTSITTSIVVNADGSFSAGFPAGSYEVTVNALATSFQFCNGPQQVQLQPPTCVELDLLTIISDCPQPSVSVAVDRFRPCFNSNIGLQICNQSQATATNTSVQVVLDPQLTYISSSRPLLAQSGDTLWFNTGDLLPMQCGYFNIIAGLDCDAIVGRTHCVEATIFPHEPCDPPNPIWDGSNIELSARCENDSAIFTLRNTGTGGMSQPRSYIIIEDNVLLRPSETLAFQLGSGADATIVLPADGSTLRLETNQAPGHPWGGLRADWVEGCGANPASDFSQGFVTQRPYGDEEPFFAIFCDESVNSYDPNVKDAYPRGIGPQHFIANTTVLDYKILFQNTGTDTAYQVVLRDTLSPLLSAATLRPGAASHPYTFSLVNGNVAVFTFNGINLVDSTTNAAGSVGFVQFKIAQTPDNQAGAEIENKAGIYFDFNAPIITPTVVRRIPQPVYQQTANVAVCNGGSWGGQTYTADAVVSDTVSYGFFDSVFVTEIQVLPEASFAIHDTLCNETSMVVNGHIYNAANPLGIEIIVNGSQAGCDSTVYVDLAFYPIPASEISATICEGESYPFYGEVLTMPGIYTQTIPATDLDCDSIVTLNLNVLPASIIELDTVVQAGTEVFGVVVLADTVFSYVEGCIELTVNANILTAASPGLAKLRQFTIAPNPASGQLTLSGHLASGAFCGAKLMDAYGRTVVQLFENEWLMGDFIRRVDLKGIPAGLYFVSFEMDGERRVLKLVVE